MELYRKGERLSKEGKFAEAVEAFQGAVETDSQLYLAYE